MSTIIAGQAASFTEVIARDGAPVPISPSSVVAARLYSADGLTPLSASVTIVAAASWSVGEILIEFNSSETTVAPGEAILVVSSTIPALTKRFRVVVETATQFTRSVLFIKDIAVDKMRADSLMVAAAGALPGLSVSDDYLWDKLRAAESEMAHELRVPLAPTAFFPSAPSQEEIDALNGKPWGIDPGYDYVPGSFGGDNWGMLKARNKPLQSVSRVRFAYPGGDDSFYDLPLDWLRMDKKHGQIQFVPSSSAFIAPLNAFVMQAIGSGLTIPLAIQLTYVAGLDDAAKNYPELLDAILKKATLKVIEDSFLPQSGSISADGLSQSMSNDMDKHADSIDRIINGGKGSNGGLMSAIHGIRFGVLG